MKALLNLLNLDGYLTLFDKFTDQSTITYSQHCWCADIWRDTLHEMLRRGKIRWAWNLWCASQDNDWDTLFELLIEYYQLEKLPE